MKTLKQFKEEYQIHEISSKVIHKYLEMEPLVKGDAIEALIAGNKPIQDKADKHLKNMADTRNRMAGFNKPTLRPAYESVESDSTLFQARSDLLNHVTNSVPSNENITKMHDLVSKVRKLGGSSETEYDNIKHNSVAPQKYRDAASLD